MDPQYKELRKKCKSQNIPFKRLRTYWNTDTTVQVWSDDHPLRYGSYIEIDITHYQTGGWSEDKRAANETAKIAYLRIVSS